MWLPVLLEPAETVTLLEITHREAKLAMSYCSKAELALLLSMPAREVEVILLGKLSFPTSRIEDGAPVPYNEFPIGY